jgi:hypothetical protein
MKSKPSAQSVIFNSRFIIGLCVFVFAVFLFALCELATINAQSNPMTQRPNAAQRVTLKSGFAKGQSAQRETLSPLGGQCVTFRGPIVTLSTTADIAFVDTAPAAFNSQADDFLRASGSHLS